MFVTVLVILVVLLFYILNRSLESLVKSYIDLEELKTKYTKVNKNNIKMCIIAMLAITLTQTIVYLIKTN